MNNHRDLHLYKALNVIRNRLTSESLLRAGLDYSQIAKLIVYITDAGLVEQDDSGHLKLTEKGEQRFEELNTNLYPFNIPGWIMPEDESRIKGIKKFDIYIPTSYNFD